MSAADAVQTRRMPGMVCPCNAILTVGVCRKTQVICDSSKHCIFKEMPGNSSDGGKSSSVLHNCSTAGKGRVKCLFYDMISFCCPGSIPSLYHVKPSLFAGCFQFTVQTDSFSPAAARCAFLKSGLSGRCKPGYGTACCRTYQALRCHVSLADFALFLTSVRPSGQFPGLLPRSRLHDGPLLARICQACHGHLQLSPVPARLTRAVQPGRSTQTHKPLKQFSPLSFPPHQGRHTPAHSTFFNISRHYCVQSHTQGDIHG